MRTVITHTVDADGLALLRVPRSDVVVEREAGADRFEAAGGPFRRYERRLDANGTGEVTETIEWSLAIPFWGFIFALPMRHALRRRRDDGHQPWWAPPDVLDARAATVLGLLCCIVLVSGYLNTLVTQTITYAADQFGQDKTAQGATLAVVRAGVLITLAAGMLADRQGRRRLLIFGAVAGSALAATGALAPNLAWLGASQVLSRGFAGATALLVAIVTAEEMPAGSRAYAVSLITMASGLGAGMCLWALPLADLGDNGWRLVYVLPLLGVPVALWVGRRLPESKRFVRPHEPAPTIFGPRRGKRQRRAAVERQAEGAERDHEHSHGRRFWLLAIVGFLLALFVAPASQFQNDFLKDERFFSAARISLFTVVTSTPAGIGIILGGRIADVKGRRLMGAIGVLGGTFGTALAFVVGGWSMWMWSLVGGIIAGLAVPALGVFRPELFPTGLRGKAAGIIEVVSLTGSALGLIAVGVLADRWGSYARPMMLVAVPAIAVALIILTKFPETAHRSLEELNPEDR